MRQIFALRAAGDGYKTIGRALNREGVKSASGHSWGKAVIRQLLHQEHYRGLVVDGKTRWVKRRGTKSRIHAPEGEWRRYDAPGPALIPGELWEAVQRVGGISRVQFGRGPEGSREDSPERAPYLLTGFTQCATCGHSLTIKKHPRSGRAAYKCSWNNERGQAGCANGASVPVQAAEEAVLNTLIGDVLDPAMIIRYLDDVRAEILEDAATPEGGADRARLTAEIARLDREIGHLVVLAAQGSPAVLQGILAREAERADLQGRLDRLTRTVPALDLAALDRALQALFDDWHHYVGSPAAIPFVRRILKQLLVSKLVFTIERGGASFTGALNLDPVLNLAAVKRISSDGPPEPAERLPVKDLRLGKVLRTARAWPPSRIARNLWVIYGTENPG